MAWLQKPLEGILSLPWSGLPYPDVPYASMSLAYLQHSKILSQKIWSPETCRVCPFRSPDALCAILLVVSRPIPGVTVWQRTREAILTGLPGILFSTWTEDFLASVTRFNMELCVECPRFPPLEQHLSQFQTANQLSLVKVNSTSTNIQCFPMELRMDFRTLINHYLFPRGPNPVEPAAWTGLPMISTPTNIHDFRLEIPRMDFLILSTHTMLPRISGQRQTAAMAHFQLPQIHGAQRIRIRLRSRGILFKAHNSPTIMKKVRLLGSVYSCEHFFKYCKAKDEKVQFAAGSEIIPHNGATS